MIPREILNKIRQIELRANREVGRVTPCAPAVRPGHAPAGKGLPALPEVGRPTNPDSGIYNDAAGVSPSPWGEGRDEGGRDHNNSLANGNFGTAQRKNAVKMPFFDVLSQFFGGLSEIYISENASKKPGEDFNTTGNAFNNRGLDSYNMEIVLRNRSISFRNRKIDFKNMGNARSNSVVDYRNMCNTFNSSRNASKNKGGAFNNSGSASKKRGDASENEGNASGIGGAAILFQECCQGVGQPTLFA